MQDDPHLKSVLFVLMPTLTLYGREGIGTVSCCYRAFLILNCICYYHVCIYMHMMCSTGCMCEGPMTTFSSLFPLWVPGVKLRLAGLQGVFSSKPSLWPLVRYLKSWEFLKQLENNYQCISVHELGEGLILRKPSSPVSHHGS